VEVQIAAGGIFEQVKRMPAACQPGRLG